MFNSVCYLEFWFCSRNSEKYQVLIKNFGCALYTGECYTEMNKIVYFWQKNGTLIFVKKTQAYRLNYLLNFGLIEF